MGVTLLFLLLMGQTSDASNINDIDGYWKLQCGDKVFHWDPKAGAPTCECGQTKDLYSAAVKSPGEVIEPYHVFKKDKISHWCCVESNIKCKGRSLGNSLEYSQKRHGILKSLAISGMYAFLGANLMDSAYTEGVKCREGVPVKIHQSCSGRCNYEPNHLYRGPLSTVPACKDTSECVKEVGFPVEGKVTMNVCTGQFRCKDKGDLEWCKSPERKSEKCPITDKETISFCTIAKCVSNLRRCLGTIPGQCVTNNLNALQLSPLRENIYFECLDRSDLNPFPLTKNKQETNSKQILDFDKIEVCERLDEDKKEESWLERTIGISLPNWLDEAERINTTQGSVVLPGLQCNQGNKGCLPRVFWCMGRMRRIQLEGMFRMPQGTTTCQLLGNLNVAEDPQLCGNYTFWSQHPCPPNTFRCMGSFNGECVSREGGCEDGSIQSLSDVTRQDLTCKEECKFKGEQVCLEKEHRCDQIPNCDDGRDEKDCQQEYLRKGLSQPGADFECESPKFNSGTFPNASVKIWAVRCDGNPTCWKKQDEQGCVLGNIIFYVVGI